MSRNELRHFPVSSTDTMGRILYIFPHPDDESFGPGPAIAQQRRSGHDVFLLTLTQGEATREREKFGYTRDEMGRVRLDEMRNVADVLDLTELHVLDFPDGGLDDLDPRDLEDVIAAKIAEVRPNVVVTYPTHGCSVHPDHLVTHAVVKRVFCALREDSGGYLKRLAFFTLDDDARVHRPVHLRGTPREEIDCVVRFDERDRERGEAALRAYETYRDVVEEHRPLETVSEGICFVFFGESFDPPAGGLMEGLGELP